MLNIESLLWAFTILYLFLLAYHGVIRRRINIRFRGHFYLEGTVALIYGSWALLMAMIEIALIVRVVTGYASISTPFGSIDPNVFMFVIFASNLPVSLICSVAARHRQP